MITLLGNILNILIVCLLFQAECKTKTKNKFDNIKYNKNEEIPEEKKLDEDEKLFDSALQAHDKKKYEKAIELFEEFEVRFPKNEKIPDAIFFRALSYYLYANYAAALATFEIFIDRYPIDERKKITLKLMFFCYYNQLTRYDRNLNLLNNLSEIIEAMRELNIKDEDVKNAIDRINQFVIFDQLKLMHLSLKSKNKKWIQAVWIASDVIKRYSNNNSSHEAYYRIIEFLINQNSEILANDAVKILKKMHEIAANSIWYNKAFILIANKIRQNAFDIVLDEQYYP